MSDWLYILIVCQNAWDESKHTRDKDGKFSESGSGCKGTASTSLDRFLGEEFTGVKGQAAVDKLMKEKKGYVKDAFTRKDIGDIALVWGNDDMGLQHIIKRRKEEFENLGKLLKSLTDVIEKGSLSYLSKGKLGIEYKGKRAVIEPHAHGEEFQFLLTAYHLK